MFKEDKKKFLKKKDKSNKGKVDDNVKKLIELINKHPDYYTTSSCAGRIMITAQTSLKKYDINKIFVSHDASDFIDVWKVIEDIPKGDIWFKFEPLILHVRCKELVNAENLVKVARKLGFKRSGIQSVKNKINVEISGTDHINAIIGKDNDLLIDGDYIKFLLAYANKKLTRNLKKIMKFEDIFKESLKGLRAKTKKNKKTSKD